MNLYREGRYYALAIAAYNKGLMDVVRILKKAGHITDRELRMYGALTGRTRARVRLRRGAGFASLEQYYAFWKKEMEKIARKRLKRMLFPWLY